MSEQKHGITVHIEDHESGQTGHADVTDNFLLICHGNTYLYSRTEVHDGTTIITIKKKDREEEPEFLKHINAVAVEEQKQELQVPTSTEFLERENTNYWNSQLDQELDGL